MLSETHGILAVEIRETGCGKGPKMTSHDINKACKILISRMAKDTGGYLSNKARMDVVFGQYTTVKGCSYRVPGYSPLP